MDIALPPGTGDSKARHDFKNHLSIILGFAEILMGEAPAGDPRRADLEEIHRAASDALALVDRLWPATSGQQP